ncbi:GH25 family lysozyme [Amycolatopsis sp. PS_44_ISF1]|uniref:GH25 family lysozyme n=1 Tax=Amycolatopsis sp. PS_44_ISF1 TaxID=2974917 RepID=UPI0028DF6DFB|nr:GH25 family lysozyme [Amycolatopsis sp. PS_44_ISF1]MDT8913333.1 GH25 family lysozyme [Amycolatopsis sp. PS_44_ISF1]
MSSARWGWRRRFGAALAVSAALTVVTAGGAQAAGETTTTDTSDNHQMGASIRAHDGVPQPGAVPSSVDASVPGIDVSSYQGSVNWASYWSAGKKFAYVKATEGTGYTNPDFTQQYNGSYHVGMIRGAYHYGRPDLSGGAAQADYFATHGGGWSKDGKTLPGTLDIEWGPNSDCYGLGASAMVAWIKAFSDEYHRKTTRWPVIYTATSWWSECTGNTGDFSSTNPLWVARYASSAGPLPYRWGFYTFWQYSSTPIDQDSFSADISRLKVLATG